MAHESEKVTCKKRIDTKLKKLGWKINSYELGLDTSLLSNAIIA